LPGRFETHEVDEVPVIVDGGHNPSGLEATLGSIRKLYGSGSLGVVFGVLRDKDIRSMLTALETEASYLVLTRPDNERAADPEWVSEHYDPRDLEGRRAEVAVDANEALNRAVREMKRTDGVVLVTGSLYTGAAILRRLRES
jgi:dihydrofolate synthase/folylpolyglutamate synthase